ncbi:homoserine kinase [Actinomadura barringtoniae]|uniref:Homoserine kinase n=1 Tax=Actinomadura barringtoniae TaxID=1427535 RepID=A0A939P960_9ACTN|nr:homoserine kinase [Actinomadura barringtoniae]MBO2448190.1 homoserine kinase [Actinomadura barringtoniae]
MSPGPTPGWASGPVTVRVPATSANLGPGFDSLGLALTLYDDVTVEVTDGGLSIEVEGEGAEVADRGERHLIVRTLLQTFELLDDLAATGHPGPATDQPGSATDQPGSAADHVGIAAQPGTAGAAAAAAGVAAAAAQAAAGRLGAPPGLRLRCTNRIPHSRGLGSSSAAIVAGIVAARRLHPYGHLLDDEGALRLATDIEGHPDNVAPCLAGGLTIAWTTDEGPRLVRLDLEREVVAFVPDQRLATERARGLLPETVPHKDAAANAGRAALLIAALNEGLPQDVLLDATEDRLHQDYRSPAMPESAALVARLRVNGVPAVISGAGPTVLAFTSASQVDSMGLDVGNGWCIHPLNVAPRGACVQPVGSFVRP